MSNAELLIKIDAVNRVVDDCFKILKPIIRDNLSDWADKYFSLSAESSHSSGKWKSYPFQIGWMDAFSNDAIEEVVIRKSRRVGYTKTLLAFIAYNVVCRRRNQALWYPTEIDRTRFVRDELNPMCRDVEEVNKLLYKNIKDDTISRKKFYGSVLNVLGGNTPRAYRGLTIDVALIDEISAFDLTIGGAVSPREAVRGRLEGAPNPKLIIGSTPRTKGSDHVNDIANKCIASMQYHIPCKHCNTFHRLHFGGSKKKYGFKGYKLDDKPKQKVRHVCKHCFKSITQHEYLKIYHLGKWISDCGKYIYDRDRQWKNPKGDAIRAPKSVSFTIWSGYSSQKTWEDIVDEWLAALEREKLGDVGPLKVFLNETLAQSWEQRHQKTEIHALAEKIGDFSRFNVPRDGLILCAGIDTQGDRWEAVTWAYGKHGQMFCVDYSVLRGNPSDLDSWDSVLDGYLQTEFTHESGKILKISAAAIDVLGHNTTNAYMYCRLREHKRVYAVRGAVTSQIETTIKVKCSQQDIDYRGRKIRNGVKLWSVGINVVKDLFFQKCTLKDKVYFYNEVEPFFFESLCSEKRVFTTGGKYKSFNWVNVYGRRNEVLDCTVYSIFAADMLLLLYRKKEFWEDRYNRLISGQDLVLDKKNEPKPGNESRNRYAQLLQRRHQKRQDGLIW